MSGKGCERKAEEMRLKSELQHKENVLSCL